MRRARLAATANPRGHDRRHGARARATFSHHIHDVANLGGLIARQNLTEHFVGPIHFDLGLHQASIKICRHRNQQSHLKRGHLRSVTLAVTFVHQFAARRVRARFQPGLSRGQRILNRLTTRIPNFGFASSLAFTTHAVIRAEAEQLRRVANLCTAKLRSEIREIDVARMLVSLIDAYVAARLAAAVVVRDRLAATRGRESSTRSESRTLHSVAERGVHHHCFEGRTRYVVFAQRAIQQRLLFAIIIELQPCGFLIDSSQAVRRIAVEREHLARLRIEHGDRAVIAFELIDDCLL